jgi:hypothetical protein
MFAAVPKNPHPLTQSFGSAGGKLVPSFCSEPMFYFLFSTIKQTQQLGLGLSNKFL